MRFCVFLFFVAAAIHTGCGDEQVASTDAARDVSVDVRMQRKNCNADRDCDDGIDCTADVCDGAKVCRNLPNSLVCDDGVFCNGVEICSLSLGCQAGQIETCDDGDVCTVDRCLEDERKCTHTLRDSDDDGEGDFRCEGGTDCDDLDPARGSLRAEVCADGIDNDCDDATDEPDCGRPPYDVCTDALDVSLGGAFSFDMRGAASDYTTSCSGELAVGRDLVAKFEVTSRQDVRIRSSSASTEIALRSGSCGASSSELKCRAQMPSELRMRSLPAGEYFVILSDAPATTFAIEVVFEDPSPPPGNTTCANAEALPFDSDVSVDLVDVSSETDFSCEEMNVSDVFYDVAIPTEQDLRILASTQPGSEIGVAVLESCGSEPLACVRGEQLSTRLRSLSPGNYTVAILGDSLSDATAQLRGSLEPPTVAPPGDSCDEPAVLMSGVVEQTSFGSADDNLQTSCGTGVDFVYTLELPSASDVLLDIQAATPTSVALKSACGSDFSEELSCQTTSSGLLNFRGLAAGTYYLVFESGRANDISISAQVQPPEMPSAQANGGENCNTAISIPQSGGYFEGNSTTLVNDYTTMCSAGSVGNDVAYQLDLQNRSRFVASTSGSSFDTTLHLHALTCQSDSETLCDDDSGTGTTSMLEGILDPGLYYFIVDGWSTTSAGQYFFDIRLEPSP